MSRERWHRVLGGGFAIVLTLLGPGYVKFGQLASTRRDLLPEWLARALERRLVLRGVLVPLAGSVAVVTADRVDGQPVAVKRLRPGAARRLHRNLRGIRRGARLLGRLPALRGVPVRRVTEDLCRFTAAQTDLRQEARNLRLLAEAVGSAEVRLPLPVPAASSADRLVMTWLERDPAFRPDGLDERDRRQVAGLLVRSLFTMIFNSGVFHCDLHPGNWWPTSANGIAIVDAGFCARLTDESRWHFVEFFFGMATGNGQRCFEHMLATGTSELAPDTLVSLRHAVEDLVRRTQGLPVREFSLAGFAVELFVIQRDHGFHGDTSFTFALIALLTVEGQLKSLHPELDFQQVARPILVGALAHLRVRFVLDARAGDQRAVS